MDNYTDAKLGRILVMFNKLVRLQVYSSSKQLIHCHIYSL